MGQGKRLRHQGPRPRPCRRRRQVQGRNRSLNDTLAALAAQADPGQFTAVEGFLGGSFSGLTEIRRNPVAAIDAAGLTGQETRDRLCGFPVRQDAELHVAWAADRLGARMSFGTFAAHVSDLWFPAVDNIVCVLHSASTLMVLVLDHEELITLSSVNPRKLKALTPTWLA